MAKKLQNKEEAKLRKVLKRLLVLYCAEQHGNPPDFVYERVDRMSDKERDIITDAYEILKKTEQKGI